MRSTVLLWSFAAALLAAHAARADWVTLKDGRTIRGVDYTPARGGRLFTTEKGDRVFIRDENITAFQESPPGELVEFRGEPVTLRAKVMTLRREIEARRRDTMASIARWAAGGDAAGDAPARVTALPCREQELCFGRTLAESAAPHVRLFAAEKLAAFKTPHARRALTVAVVADREPAVRDGSLQALTVLNDPLTGMEFARLLQSRDRSQRIRASEALRSFPVYRAVPMLIVMIRKTWTGGQQSFFFQGAHHAYISDYELVSGGTTYTLTEVADPIVKKAATGVVLDVKIARSEQVIHLQTLERITGLRYGGNMDLWTQWWEQTGLALAREAEAALAPHPSRS